VAIADAYDAMINDRPYKRAISHEQAIAELRRHAGTQFDPEIVELFCDLYAQSRSRAGPTVQAKAAGRCGPPVRTRWSCPTRGTSRPLRKRRASDGSRRRERR
jgi:hypothetical protein